MWREVGIQLYFLPDGEHMGQRHSLRLYQLSFAYWIKILFFFIEYVTIYIF